MIEIKLYKSKWKAIKLMLLCIPFIFWGIWDLTYHLSNSPQFLNWFFICFFGLGIPIGLFNLLDKRPQVILNENGISDRSSYAIFNKRENKDFIKWDLIQSVYIQVYRNSYRGLPTSKQKIVCLKLKRNTIIDTKSKSANLSRSLGLADYNIPLINLEGINEHEFITFIERMSQTDIVTKRKLLKEFKL